ncbi:hypothetical protein EDB19DRAFT_1651491, partial [Suillus lakei]
RFRILIIGRANAGKTNILQSVYNTLEKSFALSRQQHDLTYSQRGQHDIENEMVFRNNPGFVFHDSRGFEAGRESEFDTVKAFITRCSKKRNQN